MRVGHLFELLVLGTQAIDLLEIDEDKNNIPHAASRIDVHPLLEHLHAAMQATTTSPSAPTATLARPSPAASRCW